MFLPKSQDEKSEEAAATTARKEAYVRIEKWATDAVPEGIRSDLQIEVQEVQCGDPNCAPIDTAIMITFPTSGGKGMMGLPMEAREVTKEVLLESYPTEDVLTKWSKGEDAEWPPYEEDEYDDETNRPKLRFEVGQKVECRVGPDPETGWAPGEVVQLWYREASWPPNSMAPYQIQLDDGRLIFAPGDMDQVIRQPKA